jgi:hypothetical protein
MTMFWKDMHSATLTSGALGVERSGLGNIFRSESEQGDPE